MTTINVPVPESLPHNHILTLIISFTALFITYRFFITLYIAFLGPLSKYPGPLTHSLSVIPWSQTNFYGQDNVHLPALHARYGSIVRISPTALSVAATGAQEWKDVYGFRKHGEPEVTKDRLFYGQNINRVPGIITADAGTHGRQRRIVSHAFSDRALKEQEPMLMGWATKLKDKLGEQAVRGEKTDMLKMLNCTTFDIMGDLTFAEPLHMLDNSEYVPWVKTIFGGIKYGTAIRALKLLSSFNRWFLEEVLFQMPSLRKKQLEHWKYTTDRVDRRLAKEPDRPDLFTRILEKSAAGAEKGEGLSLQEYYSISSLFMIAGTETTATALSGTTFHLLKNRKYLDMLQKELRGAFAGMDDMTLEALAHLPMLEAVIKEGIRMYPPVPIGLPRVSPPGGMTVGDHFVPEGTAVAVHQLATYRSEDNFKHAHIFRPERWMEDPEFKDDRLDALEPFSVGPRNCLGKNLAWHEMRLLLSTVLLHYDLELCPESEKWADQKVYTLWEKPSLFCRLTAVKA